MLHSSLFIARWCKFCVLNFHDFCERDVDMVIFQRSRRFLYHSRLNINTESRISLLDHINSDTYMYAAYSSGWNINYERLIKTNIESEIMFKIRIAIHHNIHLIDATYNQFGNKFLKLEQLSLEKLSHLGFLIVQAFNIIDAISEIRHT